MFWTLQVNLIMRNDLSLKVFNTSFFKVTDIIIIKYNDELLIEINFRKRKSIDRSPDK